jgi:hypothetical protein
MVLNLLFQSIIQNFSSKSTMYGGKLNQPNPTNNIFLTFLILIILLLLKGYIVFIIYNSLVPKLIHSFSDNKSLENKPNNFRELSFTESILLVILTNTLFS